MGREFSFLKIVLLPVVGAQSEDHCRDPCYQLHVPEAEQSQRIWHAARAIFKFMHMWVVSIHSCNKYYMCFTTSSFSSLLFSQTYCEHRKPWHQKEIQLYTIMPHFFHGDLSNTFTFKAKEVPRKQNRSYQIQNPWGQGDLLYSEETTPGFYLVKLVLIYWTF